MVEAGPVAIRSFLMQPAEPLQRRKSYSVAFRASLNRSYRNIQLGDVLSSASMRA